MLNHFKKENQDIQKLFIYHSLGEALESKVAESSPKYGSTNDAIEMVVAASDMLPEATKEFEKDK